MQEEMRALVDRLNETAYQYYTLGEPTISDKGWDEMYNRLIDLERQTGTRLPDSPTRRVGGEVLAAFAPHRHLARLWSLDKAQSEQALLDWAGRVEKLLAAANLPTCPFFVEHKFDGLTINLANYEVKVNGKAIPFTPKEVEILYLLASHPGQVFDREQILSRVWGYDYFGDTRAVDTQIKRIRQKFPEDAKGFGIRTIYGVGYKFEVEA